MITGKNPVFTADGSILLEIEHPQFGWMPYLASENDQEPFGKDVHARAVAGEFGEIAPYVAPVEPELTLEQKIAALESALDDHLDAVAQQYRFADRTRLALRAGYPNAWQALGTAFGTWMDQCNALVAAGLQEVIAGTRPLPTAEEMIAGLPEFVAP